MRSRRVGAGILGVMVALSVLGVGMVRLGRPARGEQRAEAFRQIAIGMLTYTAGVIRDIPPIDWGDGFVARRGICFDKPLVDLESGRELGRVTECFADVREAGAGMLLRNVSFLTLPGGTIVARHRTSLQPLLDPDSPASHAAVSFPPAETLNIVSTTGEFRGRTGQVRILGAMNLQNFRPGADSAVKFNQWVYLIQLNKPPGDRDGN